MRIYNEEKTKELIYDTLDFNEGHLIEDTLILKHHEAIEAKSVQEQVEELLSQGKEVEQYDNIYYLVLKKYNTGGKDLLPILEIKHQEAWDETEKIFIFKLFTEEEKLDNIKNELRKWRLYYLNILDRACWYDCLTQEQKEIAKAFRQQLLDITDTLIKPNIPDFIEKEIKN